MNIELEYVDPKRELRVALGDLDVGEAGIIIEVPEKYYGDGYIDSLVVVDGSGHYVELAPEIYGWNEDSVEGFFVRPISIHKISIEVS